MALSDQQMQFLQKRVTTFSSNDELKIKDDVTGQQYKVINRTPGDPNSDDVTQAIAVAPMDKNGNVDYSQTAIVVAGTQQDNSTSFWNAVRAGWDPTSSISAQTQDIRNFYQSTKKIVQQHPNGYISNMSGFSQSGPPVAKVACEQQVPHITNFDDWASRGATTPYLMGLFKNLPHEYLTPSDIEYLNTHAHVYLDAYRSLTSLDGGGGNVPYGKQFIVQSSDIDPTDYVWIDKKGLHANLVAWMKDHKPSFARIKDNGLDIDWYIRNNQFCSGMTYDQVLQVAKNRAKNAEKKVKINGRIVKISASLLLKWGIQNYIKTYGAFASDDPIAQKLDDFNQNIKTYKSDLKSATDRQVIFLRQELVKTVAQKSKLQAEEFVKDIQQLVEESKASIEHEIQEVRREAYELAQRLPAWEVENLLSELTMTSCWDVGIETETLKEAKTYLEKMITFSEKITKGAEELVATDKEGAKLFQ